MQPRLGQILAPYAEGEAPVLLRWWEWGPPDGFPVLCVHGLTRNARDFDALAAALASEGRRVLCADVPGRGVSGWLPRAELYAVPTYAAIFQSLLAQLGEHDWVGTSMGGLIGMALASLPGSRTRRFVVNDVGPHLPGPALARIRRYMQTGPHEFGDFAELEAFVRETAAPFGALSDAEWRHLAEHSARALPDGRVALHYDPLIKRSLGEGEAAEDLELWPVWDAATKDRPTLVLRGETSDLLLPETAARMAAGGARVETIPGCGHAPALMDPAQIGLVAGFLR